MMLALSLFTSALMLKNDEVLVVHYHERPPFYVTQKDGTPGGLIGEPVARALMNAKIPAHYQITPAKRQLMLIESGQHNACAVGWFKNAQRAKQMQFSLPIYRDKPIALVHRKNDNRFSRERKLQVVFQQPYLWLKKASYSYGPVIDQLNEQFKPKFEQSFGENVGLMHMIARGRADYLLASEEEIEHLLQISPALSHALSITRLTDIPAGEYRYLVCSKKTPATTMDDINRSLAAITPFPS